MVDDEELIELVEEEVRDLLDENGFDRDCPVIHTPLTVLCTTTLRTTRSGSSPLRTSWTLSTTTSRPRFTTWTSRS